MEELTTDALIELYKVKRQLFEHKYRTATTDDLRQYYKGAKEAIDLAITLAVLHNRQEQS